MTKEIYESCLRRKQDLGAFFEYDGEVGYFYMIDDTRPEDKSITDAIRIAVGEIDFEQNDVDVKWDITETKVALTIHGRVWAFFDTETGQKFGGNYQPGKSPDLPELTFLAS